MLSRRMLAAQLLAMSVSAIAAGIATLSPAHAERTVVDMAGRSVQVPDKVARVGTIGPVPVLNSFVFALGEAKRIANNLPPNLGGPRWRFQYVVAPDLRQRPVIQGADGPNIESIMSAAPDVVLTMDRTTVDRLARTGIPTVFLSWRQPDDVKTAMRLLGELFSTTDAAKTYCRFFDATMFRVGARVDTLSTAQRPRVLYGSLKRLTQPHKIAEWWINKAGGRSVTNNGRTGEAFDFSIEQVLDWDPEVIIVSTPDEISAVYADPRIATVSAIRNRRVHAVPMGVHLWGNRTVEQPLTVLWAAKVIHPELFQDVAMTNEVRTFYADFFRTDLNDDDINVILDGRAGDR